MRIASSLLLIVLAVLAIWAAAWPVCRAGRDVEISYNEGWNAFFADAALAPGPLYPPPDQLVTNNYPPLSFYLVGLAGRLAGDPIVAGRVLSLLAAAGISLGAAATVRRLGGDRRAAVISGLYCLATLGRFFPDYVGMNDPHLLGQAVMTGGFVLFLRAVERDRGYLPAVLVLVAGGFVKHVLVVLPLTAVVWLAVQRPNRLLPVGGAAVVLVAGGLGACVVGYGPDFLYNLTSPRVYDLGRALGSLGHLQWVAVGLAAAAHVTATRWTEPRVRLMALLVGLGLLVFVAQKTGAGVANNAQFELLFGVAVAVGLAITDPPGATPERRRTLERLRLVLLVAAVARLLASGKTEPVRLLFDPSFPAEIARRERAMADTVARIRDTPGDLDTSLYALYRAGRPFTLDGFNTRQRMHTGRLPPDTLERLRESGRLTVVTADPLSRWQADPAAGGRPSAGPARGSE